MLRLLVTLLLLLANGIALPARPTTTSKVLALGTITQASGAHFNASTASPGGTVYDGDVLSTEDGGTLQFRGNTALVYLAGSSSVTLRSIATGTQATLHTGTAVVSAAGTTALEIFAGGATIRLLADVPTIAQITIIGPKELQIYTRRGALRFSYNAESATLREGSSYRILLDLQETSPAQKSQNGPHHSGRKLMSFKIIIGAAAGLATGIALYHVYGTQESPDHP